MIQVLDKYGNTSTDDGNILIYDKFGHIKRVTSGATPIGPAGGDLSGTYPNPSVIWNNGTPTYNLLYYPIPTGTTSDYIRGDGSIAAFPTIPSGTVTSVAALTLGTTGTDLSSTVATGTTTPVITLNVPTASATNRGALSSADWTTFNNKQDKSLTAYKMLVNNTNVTANAAETNFRSQGLQALTGITFVGSIAPSGGSQSYQFQQVGNLVTATFTLIYGVGATLLTQMNIALPSDMPTPIRPTGVAATAGNKCYVGYGTLSTSLTVLQQTFVPHPTIVVNAADTSKFDVLMTFNANSARYFYITVTYFTS